MTMIDLVLNGVPRKVGLRPGWTLLDLLRDGLGLTGAKEGCTDGECGACTVLVDDRPVLSCLWPAARAAGRSVRTVEGLAGGDGEPSPLQRAFIEHGAVQCGYCVPGMLMAATALLERDPRPCADTVREALGGNLCRCGNYTHVVRAVLAAAGSSPANDAQEETTERETVERKTAS
ncbi:MAG TPA: (2Fe-2S)-binding protein [Spirillospora sp.]